MGSIMQDLGMPAPQKSLGETIVEPFESFYGTIGAITPAHRLVVTFAMASVIEFLVEPGFAFTPQGRARPFKLLDDQDPDSTYLHWAVLPLVVGVASALFV